MPCIPLLSHVSHSSRRTHPIRPSPRPSITPPSRHRRTTQAAVRSHNHKLGSTRAGASGKAQKGPPNADMKSGGKQGRKAAAPVSDASAPWPVATRETTYSHLNALVCLSPGPLPLFFFEQTKFCSTGARKRLDVGVRADRGGWGRRSSHKQFCAPRPATVASRSPLRHFSPPIWQPLAALLALAHTRSLSRSNSLTSSFRPSLRCPLSLRYQTSSNTACT